MLDALGPGERYRDALFSPGLGFQERRLDGTTHLAYKPEHAVCTGAVAHDDASQDAGGGDCQR